MFRTRSDYEVGEDLTYKSFVILNAGGRVPTSEPLVPTPPLAPLGNLNAGGRVRTCVGTKPTDDLRMVLHRTAIAALCTQMP